MLKIARIALLRPHPEETELLKRALAGEYFSVRQVERPDQVLTLIEEEGAEFDAIILPPKSFDLDGGLTFCSQIKDTTLLRGIPIISLVQQVDDHFAQCLFDSGTTAIYPSPFNPITLRSLISSQRELKQSAISEAKLDQERSSLSSVTLQIFDNLDSGVLVFNSKGEVVYSNRSLMRIFGELDENSQELQLIGAQVTDGFPQILSRGDPSGSDPQYLRKSLKLSSGYALPCSIRINKISDEYNRLIGWCCYISQNSSVDHLADLLKHTRALRANLINSLTHSSDKNASIKRVLGSLLEALDRILPDNTHVQLNEIPDKAVNLPGEILISLLANSIFLAADSIYWRGKIEISSPRMAMSEAIKIKVVAERSGLLLEDKSDLVGLMLRSLGLYLSGDTRWIKTVLDSIIGSDAGIPIQVEESREGVDISFVLPIVS